MTKIIRLHPYGSEQLPILGMNEMDLGIDDQIFMSMYHEYLAQGGTEKDFKEKQAAYISQAMSGLESLVILRIQAINRLFTIKTIFDIINKQGLCNCPCLAS